MRGEGIVPVMEVGNNNSGFGGFGNNSDWAWIIILFLIFGNNRGFGNGFGGGSSVGENYILATDFATVERKIDSVNAGLCDGFYKTAEQVYGLQNTLCQGFAGINQNIVSQGYENRLGTQLLSSELAKCCCDIREGISGVNYNLATNTCAITNNATMNTRDIIDAINCNYRTLHDEIVKNRIEDKDSQIREQQNEINALRLSASQLHQNQTLLNELRNGCPVNAQLVCGNQPIPIQYIGACNPCNPCGCNNY